VSWRTCWVHEEMEEGDVTSSWVIERASLGWRDWSLAADLGSRHAAMTVLFLSRHCLTNSKPMPLDAPVTTTTLFAIMAISMF